MKTKINLKISPPRRGEMIKVLGHNFESLGLMILLLLFFSFSNGIAQNNATSPKTIVNGKVIDKTGLSVPGVTVLEKGTKNATQTDFDGNFSLPVASPQSVIVYSFVGMQTIEKRASDGLNPTIVMKDLATDLNEIVVIGYGTQKKAKLISAVDRIGSAAFKDRPSVNATTALQGKAPSLTIQQTNSEPGAGVNINIRGVSTLGNSNPLIVIDGITGGDINALNPADIENVSVLKDAGSAAIYGSRASNGVILITTKKGNKSSPMTLQFSSLIGYNTPKFFTKPVHGYENAMLRNEAAYNSGEASAVFTSAQIAEMKQKGDTKWFAKEIVKPALQQNYNISATGGNENSTYLVSLGYLDNESVFVGPEKGMERFNYRINLTNEFGKFKLTSILAYSKQKIKDHAGSTGTLMVDAFRVPLYYEQKDENGNYLTNDILQEFNSLGILEKGGFRKYDNDDIFGSLNAELKLTNYLKLKGVIGGRVWSNTMYKRVQKVQYFPKGVSGADANTEDENKKIVELNSQLMLEFNKSFGSHNVSALIGATGENFKERGVGVYKKFTDPDLGTPITETIIDPKTYNSNEKSGENSLNSLIGRASYDYDSKYFAEFTFRYDGSSKFAEENRWGFFPSVAVGYALTKENFMEGYRNAVGNLKFKSSYGVVGNQNVGNYQYQTTYFGFANAYGYNNAVASGTGYNFANPDIQWENAATFNAGLDADFFNGAFGLSFEFFDKVTSDILLKPQVPGVYGTDLPDFNSGKLENKGWELTATYRHAGKLFNHNLSVNIGDSKNKVLDYNHGQERLQGVEELQVLLREGLPFNSYVGLKTDGYFQNYEEIQGAAVPVGLTVQPGDNRYVDLNKDGKIDENDKFVFGNPFPRYTFGVTYDIAYKGFDVNIFIQGVGKRTMMIRGELVEPFHYNYGMTMYTHQLDYWTPQNPNAEYPRLANNGSQSNTNNFRRGSDMYLYDGAYARLKNLQIGYTLPENAIKEIGLKSFRMFVSGQNLLTLSKVKFVDPELSEFDNSMRPSGGNSGRAYPTQVYYGLGLDVTF